MIDQAIRFIREQFNSNDFIPLHEPRFQGNEKAYLLDCIDSTFVSSVGAYVTRFEQLIVEYTGATYAVATSTGTSGLHVALHTLGVSKDEEVLTQPLSFVATANAIKYCGAHPVFLDVDRDTMGLSPEAIETFLTKETENASSGTGRVNKTTGRRIAACVPMHTFGMPCRIDEIVAICKRFDIPVVEDAAESLGSFYKDQHTGSFGVMGVFSLNGNKTITCGGGGVVITNNQSLAIRAKHLSTTAKVPHAWEYQHDEVGFNYRLPNLNAAVACAQVEQLEGFLKSKRRLAHSYAEFFDASPFQFVHEPDASQANYWLNALILENITERDRFLMQTNESGVMTRPVWKLLNTLSPYRAAQCDALVNAQWLEERLVNIPSSVPKK